MTVDYDTLQDTLKSSLLERNIPDDELEDEDVFDYLIHILLALEGTSNEEIHDTVAPFLEQLPSVTDEVVDHVSQVISELILSDGQSSKGSNVKKLDKNVSMQDELAKSDEHAVLVGDAR